MSQKQCWGWVAFILSVSAYVPVAIGGWMHPSEMNVASYSIWLVVSGMVFLSSRSQGFSGWRLALGFTIGNACLLLLSFIRGGYTFNLRLPEVVALYGVVGAISLWVVVGTTTKKWSPRILFLGGISADILSFYPQIKQYLLPHDPPTELMLWGWLLWILAAFVSIVFVEEFLKKLGMDPFIYELTYKKPKKALLIIEESMFSLENYVLMIITVVVMTRH